MVQVLIDLLSSNEDIQDQIIYQPVVLTSNTTIYINFPNI